LFQCAPRASSPSQDMTCQKIKYSSRTATSGAHRRDTQGHSAMASAATNASGCGVMFDVRHGLVRRLRRFRSRSASTRLSREKVRFSTLREPRPPRLSQFLVETHIPVFTAGSPSSTLEREWKRGPYLLRSTGNAGSRRSLVKAEDATLVGERDSYGSTAWQGRTVAGGLVASGGFEDRVAR
jgi:hypothetical protein